jgi:Icc-related predicted phosphoesterase
MVGGMRVHVVSDVHGAVEALAAAGDGADAVVCLGDLVLFVDYADTGRGIFGDLFGAERAAQWVRLRDEGRLAEAGAYLRGLWSGIDGDAWAVVESGVRRQYEALFAAMPVPAYLTYGNVDVPRLWPEYLRPGHTLLDGETAEIGGRTFGFVGGGLVTPHRTPFEVSDEEYAAKVATVFAGGGVDVLCCHIPPALPELTYDVVARRFERGSEAVLSAIHEHAPPLVLFGHVHQPLAARMRVGRTECVNVGHFRASGTPYVLQW